MEGVTNTVQRLANETDAVGRQRIMDHLQTLMCSLENPNQTLHRFVNLHVQSTAIRIGVALKIFDLLAASDGSMTLAQLQEGTGAARLFLGRFLRYLASITVIGEKAMDTFFANRITKALAIPGVQAGLCFVFDTLGPSYQELPRFLAQIGYQDITDGTVLPHQVAHNTPLPAFDWLKANSKQAAYFNDFMAYRHKGQLVCWDAYPIEREAKGLDPEAPLLVDIGGGIGHICAEFKEKFPHLPGRVILEDLPGPISNALSTPGVENIAHSMFDPQPIKGAKFYYFKAVIHNWPDDKVREILKNIIPAMGSRSAILFDDLVLPDSGVYWHAASMDLTMMAFLGAIERTQSQWRELVESVGLKIEKITTYSPLEHESIITIIRK
ncbi:hypothetical protein ACLMJK_008410 [Lecanora helva]